MAGRTTFVVANRLSLLKRADVILVLSKGRLVQTGSHDDLVQAPGPYRDAALLQLMDLAPGDGLDPGAASPNGEKQPAHARLAGAQPAA
jgi:ATP-binding cassette subfamily B protein